MSLRSQRVQRPPERTEEQCPGALRVQTEGWTERLRAEGLLPALEGDRTTTTPTPQHKSKTRPQQQLEAPSHWGAFSPRNTTPGKRRAPARPWSPSPALPAPLRPPLSPSSRGARIPPDPGSVGGSHRVRSTRPRHTAPPGTRGRGREPTPAPQPPPSQRATAGGEGATTRPARLDGVTGPSAPRPHSGRSPRPSPGASHVGRAPAPRRAGGGGEREGPGGGR